MRLTVLERSRSTRSLRLPKILVSARLNIDHPDLKRKGLPEGAKPTATQGRSYYGRPRLSSGWRLEGADSRPISDGPSQRPTESRPDRGTRPRNAHGTRWN